MCAKILILDDRHAADALRRGESENAVASWPNRQIDEG